MYVEFDNVRGDAKEAHDKNINREVYGEANVSFYNEEDYISKIVVDIKLVESFALGRAYFNNQQKEVIYYKEDGEWTGIGLIVDYELFKSLFEEVHGKIIKVSDYGSNSKGI